MTQATVLKNGHVFDGERFLPGATDVVFRDGAIVAVGRDAGLAAEYAEATVVDCAGRTVLPGIIDLHVHVMTSTPGSIQSMVEPYSLQFYESVKNLEATLRAGVTTARDAGGADLGAKTAVESGLIKGPRLRLAVSIMSQTGGHGDMWHPSGLESPDFGPHPGRPSGIADGVEEVRKVTRTLLRAGADQIKICSTGGVLSPTTDPRHSQFTPAEIAVIVEEAGMQGKYVMAHAQGTAGIINALRAGVRTIEHGIYLTDEAIQLFLDSEAYLVPTLSAPLAVIRKGESGSSGLSQQVIDKAQRVAENHRQSVARAIAAGVKIGMGTDAGVGEHGDNLEELSLMADAGMNLEQVLAASTSVPGELITPVGAVGRLAEKHLADVVVLNGLLESTEQLAGLRGMIGQVYQGGVLQFQEG
ncbi:imidazolonepropionase-like amidohydrolase [Arthrobacter sp. CAN_A212]|uniref:metal-dependent hydrolase family protein n=1 Tax=unclassified Arthrobacter TaxID=235627 RepID=UPI0018CBA1DC|nr:amidohydrolase family protein [Arthrobacter sp. CAN_C5]MBP2217987.1 imidazolonepropionase-like amidohydrolase [Arthrobacter sp. CAN_C5]